MEAHVKQFGTTLKENGPEVVGTVVGFKSVVEQRRQGLVSEVIDMMLVHREKERKGGGLPP